MYMVHMHDNHGQSDEHLIPFRGTFDWPAFAKVLAGSPYKPPYLLEINKHGESDAEFFKAALAAGEKLRGMLDR
jgi:sugar phosphate isomerase/epimerase